MRKFGKAILSAVLAVAICLSSLTFTASAVENSKLTDEQIETLMQSASFTDKNGTTLNYRYYVPEGYDGTKEYPVVLFLHGAGERGNNNISQIKADSILMNLLSPTYREAYPCIAIAPQCPDGKQWMDIPSWGTGSYSTDAIPENDTMKAVIGLLENVKNTYQVDDSRVYLTGLSMGGYGSWDALVRHPNLFAGAVICCGAGDPSKASMIKDIPVWVFHGDADDVVPVSGSRDMVDALMKAGASSVNYTEMPGVNHVCWPAAFATDGLFSWLFNQDSSTEIGSKTTAGAITPADGTKLNLTERGNADWIHLYANGMDRKAGVSERIGFTDLYNPESLSNVSGFSDSRIYYSWSDGTPTGSAADNRVGGTVQYRVGEEDSVGVDIDAPAGYEVTVPAAKQAQTLTMGLSLWRSKATLTVEAEGQSQPVFEEVLENQSGSTYRLLTVEIAPGDTVKVTFQYNKKYYRDGNVTLGGAALHIEPDEVWYRDELEVLIDKAERLMGDAGEDDAQALGKEIEAAKVLIGGAPSFDELKAQFEKLQSVYAQVDANVNGGSYLYDSYSRLTSSFGWEGDIDAPIAYLDGSYKLRNNGNKMITFGVKDIPGKIKWYNAEGYLPCFVSEYSKNGMDYKIENFADKVEIDGNAYEIAYSRMTVTNNSDKTRNLPAVSKDLTPINDAAKNTFTIAPGATVVRDWCVGADRFGGTYAYPAAAQLEAQGGFDKHYTHMKNYWNDRLAPLTEIKALPDEELINAYKAGYIYTLIIKDDVPKADGSVNMELHVGENGYDRVFDHDIIGMMVGLMTVGDFEYFDEYSKTILMNVQYEDARWKFSWPFAYYLQKTGDKEYIRTRFEEIKTNTHYIEKQRTGPGTIMMDTYAVDTLGSWTIDNWAALMGLTSYKYICEQLGETEEAAWAKAQYDSLFEAISSTIEKTVKEYDLDYIPASPNDPNDNNRCSNPKDGNWAAHFMFGRWGWDGYLFGAEQSGVMLDMIDDTYAYGLGRLAAVGAPAYTFGGYPGLSSGYNAGYGSTALRGEEYRDVGIKAYQYMIENTQSGPFGWWENISNSTADTPWEGNHATSGGGSCQHMWGQSVATKMLFDSLIAEKSDGTVIIGRGIPAEWVTDGEAVEIDKAAVSGGKMGYRLSVDGTTVTLRFNGDAYREKSVELLAFKDNIVSAGGLQFDAAAGVVTVPAGVSEVVIEMKGDPKEKVDWKNANDALQRALNNAPDYTESADAYTKESYGAYASALAAARAMLQDDARTAAGMNAAAEALQNAVSGMKLIDITEPVIDYTGGVYNNTYEFGKLHDQYKRYQTFIAKESAAVSSIGVGVQDAGATSGMTVEVYTLKKDRTPDTLLAHAVVDKSDINLDGITTVQIGFEMEEGKVYGVVLGQVTPDDGGKYQWDTNKGGVDGENYFIKWNKENDGSDEFVDESFLGHGVMRINTVKYSKKGLEDLILSAKALNPAGYTTESWKNLLDTLDSANAVLQNSMDIDEVKAAEEAVKKAVEALIKAAPKPDVDRSRLLAALKAYETLNPHDYTADSFKKLQQAVDAANRLGGDAAQAQLDAAANGIFAAIEALVPLNNPQKADRSRLSAALSAAQSLKQSDYTDLTWDALQKAVKEALALPEDATQQEVDAAAKAVFDSLQALVRRGGSSEDPGKDEPGSNTPTGDGNPVLPLALLAMLSCAGVVLLRRAKK